MSDLISRQAAIDAIEREKSLVERPITETRWFDLGLGKAQDILSELPSAQPEQKSGKWIEKEIYETRRKEEMQVAKCSNCGKYLTTPHIYSFNHYSFCLNCGAKMGGEK